MHNDSFQHSVFIPISQENSRHMHEFQSYSGVLVDHVLTGDGKRTGFFTCSVIIPEQMKRKPAGENSWFCRGSAA